MYCQSSKKDTILHLLFGLGVDLDQTFGSKRLPRHLSRLGLSIKPDEVTLYWQPALDTSTTLSTTLQNGAFIHWSVDNVDHNLATLMEKERFTEWRLWQLWPLRIASVNSPKLQDWRKQKPVAEIVKDREVPIFNYNGRATLESFLKISPLKTLKVRQKVSFDLESEVFWHSNCYFSSPIQTLSL